MKYILSLFTMLVVASAMMVSNIDKAEAKSHKGAVIAGAIIGGAIAGAAVSHHYNHRHHRRYYRRGYRAYDDGYEYEVSARRCYREERCRIIRPARRWRSRGVRYYRPARKRCRIVRVCR